MNSWRERFVEGLKNWRSPKNDGVANELSDVARSADSDPEPNDHQSQPKLSTMVTFDDTDADTFQEIKPTSPPEALVTVNEPQTLEERSSQAELANEEEAVHPAVSSSVSKLAQRRSPAGTTNADQVIDRELAVLKTENGSAVEISDRESVDGNVPKPPDRGRKRRARIQISATEHDEAGGKACIENEPENAAETRAPVEEQVHQEPVNHTELMKAAETIRENSIACTVPALSQKRRYVRKRKTNDGQVTDEDLAELDAENARLKLLLHERLNARQSNSEK